MPVVHLEVAGTFLINKIKLTAPQPEAKGSLDITVLPQTTMLAALLNKYLTKALQRSALASVPGFGRFC